MADQRAKAYAKDLATRLYGLRDLDDALRALMTAFVGLIMSSFLMARVGARAGFRASVDDKGSPPDRGDLVPSARTFWLVLLASAGLATSALFALWGLANLIDGVPGQDGTVITLVWLVFVATSILAVAFVAAAAADLRAAEAEAEATEQMWWEHARALWERVGLGPTPSSVAQEAVEPAGAEPEPPPGADHQATEPAVVDAGAVEPAGVEEQASESKDPLWWERVGLAVAAVLGGTVLFFIGVILYSLGAREVSVPTPETSITAIAIIYLAIFTIFVVAALAISSSNMAEAPRWLRGRGGAAAGYFVVAAPLAVAWALFLRLPLVG